MKRSVLAPVALLALHACGAPVIDPDRRDREDNGVASVFVTITTGDRGTPTEPLPFSSDGRTFTLRIEARDLNNQILRSFNDYMTLSVTPGVLLRIESAAGGQARGRSVPFVNGVADGVRVTFGRAYGEVRVWAEDNGYVPADPNSTEPPQCANGRDDDGDGRSDFPADYGCAAPNDDSERGGSYAVGASEAIYFGSPRVYDVQGGGTTSPLVNERVTIESGSLVVTRISIAGFWVTDTADRSCTDPMDPSQRVPCYNSLFMFNFRLPEGLRPCDRLSRLQGTVQEFVSTTQLSQPSWQVDPNGGLWIDEQRSGACPIPAAVPLTPSMLSNTDTMLEPHENSLVRVQNVVLSRNVGPALVSCDTDTGNTVCNFAPGRSNCDLNRDGTIDFNNPAESACANTCQRERGCSEWTNWTRYGQLTVDFMSGQPGGVQRLIIAPKEAISNFNPQAQPVPAGEPVTVTGTLKQVGPNWIIEPRCTQDLASPTLGVEPRPTNQTCLIPRTVTEEP
jgi:hypothetical protein